MLLPQHVQNLTVACSNNMVADSGKWNSIELVVGSFHYLIIFLFYRFSKDLYNLGELHSSTLENTMESLWSLLMWLTKTGYVYFFKFLKLCIYIFAFKPMQACLVYWCVLEGYFSDFLHLLFIKKWCNFWCK